MTITARVHHHSIALPTEVEIPEGTEVQVVLPEKVSPGTEAGPLGWMEEFVGCLGTLPTDAAERQTEYARERKRQRS